MSSSFERMVRAVFRQHISLSFADIGMLSKDQRQRENLTVVTLVLLILEVIIACLCMVQLLRFMQYRVFLKKVVHALIIVEMLACIFQAVDIVDIVYERFLHEATFVICSLLYLSVFLFWVDFLENLKNGSSITILRSKKLLLYMGAYACVYLGLWLAIQRAFFTDEEWRLTIISRWWHLIFYASLSIGMVRVSYSIRAMLQESQFPILTHRCFAIVKKASKTLYVVSSCFMLRSFATILFIVCQNVPLQPPMHWDSWIGFLILYLFDRILPVLVFIVLMRHVPNAQTCNMGIDSPFSLRGVNFL